MKRIPLIATPCLILLCQTALAPIYSSFENLNLLIDRAEFIVVAEIIKRPPAGEMDMGDGGTFEIEIIKVLNGNAKPGRRSKAYLRNLPFSIQPHDSTSLTQGFIPGERYLLFLNKPGTSIHDENGKPLPVDYENENCEGDAVWISLTTPVGYFDLDSLNVKSTREAVVALLNHTATEQEKFATGVRAIIESRADRNAITQKITQVVWLDNKAEEAANFYLSVFKNSRKDPNINQYAELSPDLKGTFTGVRLWIDGQDIVLLNRGPNAKTQESSALTLNCDLQEQIDYYWDKLSAGGQKSRGGWVKDKFGLWWHIIPTDLPHLLGGKYGDSRRVMEALSKMDKIDSGALVRAAHPEYYKSDGH